MSDTASLAQRIRTALQDIREPGAVALLQRLTPTLSMMDLTQPENYDATDRRYCVGQGNFAAVAGQAAQVQLFNPENSGVLTLVKSWIAYVENEGFVNVCRFDTQLAGGTGTKGFADSRITGGPATLVLTSTAVGQGTFLYGNLASGNLTTEVARAGGTPTPFLIAPNTGYLWRTDATSDKDIYVSFEWEEIVTA